MGGSSVKGTQGRTARRPALFLGLDRQRGARGEARACEPEAETVEHVADHDDHIIGREDHRGVAQNHHHSADDHEDARRGVQHGDHDKLGEDQPRRAHGQRDGAQLQTARRVHAQTVHDVKAE